MERPVRAYFRAVRISRLVVATFLLVLLIVIFLLPGGGSRPVSAPRESSIKQGVVMWGRDFSGKSESEARAMLAEMAPGLESDPRSAAESLRVDGVSYVVPEVNGQSLDLENTLFRLKMAAEGSLVEPATRIKHPERRLSDFPDGVIRRGNPVKAVVSFLINVDWGTPEVAQMAPILKRRGVRVTFFVSGRWAQQNPDLLRTLTSDGHEVASHGHNLSSGPASLARAGQLRADIERSVAVIEKTTGHNVRYYAPHMSEINPEIVKTARELNLRTVLYSLDTIDWRDSTTGEMILTRIGRAKAGDLILLHPKPNTVKVLEQAILDLQSRNLTPVTLSELLSPDPGRADSAWTGEHE